MRGSDDSAMVGFTTLHTPINSTVKTEAADAPVDIKLSFPKTSSGEGQETFRQLKILSARAEQLRKEQETHLQKAQELQRLIEAGELACGRMTQQVLQTQEVIRQMTRQVAETQNAIDIRRRHINEDEDRLSQEMRSRARKTEEIMSIVSQINTLAIEANAEASTSGASLWHESD
ncbi:uncharacterized protein Z518_04934 [Rhinocladiella mackenziei CBS 650.93]|uniref:Uncharacterized protein n=1 Tax=Rhinocladiella mackenziei CBS 650.93 TaxID=1442369 RepID=A0A0D2H908_9EURO|nr:uncharacterized protein Z518_04934 [Rhinocladiella mackenziei CBS 650.93]KIX06958.1 hypothetical protein Z518_04934 [Rhinocladiella mackenziei CBS 650.93]